MVRVDLGTPAPGPTSTTTTLCAVNHKPALPSGAKPITVSPAACNPRAPRPRGLRRRHFLLPRCRLRVSVQYPDLTTSRVGHALCPKPGVGEGASTGVRATPDKVETDRNGLIYASISYRIRLSSSTRPTENDGVYAESETW